ncbi:eukaryotic translation initiation factor 3 subunit F [Elysia marginata]|uniref:Eukaryotic translation initiation factor 3 subunit F n=1 Tax=Elysia marginata TaxID=1093978 RepID=A0AAV4IY29_9GAST|nr:eukaryotic translation initiation factor 3 subunit F [Elysia marginata]
MIRWFGFVFVFFATFVLKTLGTTAHDVSTSSNLLSPENLSLHHPEPVHGPENSTPETNVPTVPPIIRFAKSSATSTHSTLSTWPPLTSESSTPPSNMTMIQQFCKLRPDGWAKQEGKCDLGLPDQESDSAFWQSRHMCINRCGKAQVYGEVDSECNCDAACVVYGDCCEDMATTCATLYTAALASFGPNISPEVACSNNYDSVVINCGSKSRPGFLSRLPGSMENEPENTSEKVGEPGKQQNNLKSLRYYVGSFNSFFVYDHFLKVVLKNQEAFSACKFANSWPQFLSKTRSFSCPDSYSPSGTISAREILTTCMNLYVSDSHTGINRRCISKRAIVCACWDGSLYFIPLHQACMGITATQKKRLSMSATSWDKKDYNLLYPYDLGDCNIITPKFSTAVPRVILGPSSVWTMAVLPVAFPTNKKRQAASSSNGMHNEDINRRLDNASATNYLKRKTLFVIKNVSQYQEAPAATELQGPGDIIQLADSQLSINYVVELTNTLETRLRCQRLQVTLSHCQLEECAEGAVIMYEPKAGRGFGGHSCVVPVQGSVVNTLTDQPATLCTCLRVISALRALKIWHVTIISRESCVFRLRKVEELRFGSRHRKVVTNRLVISASAHGMEVATEKSKVLVNSVTSTNFNTTINGKPLSESPKQANVCGVKCRAWLVHKSPLLATVKRRKLAWFGHMTRHDGLCKTTVQGAVEGSRRRGRQKKSWLDNVKEWTKMTLPDLMIQGILYFNILFRQPEYSGTDGYVIKPYRYYQLEDLNELNGPPPVGPPLPIPPHTMSKLWDHMLRSSGTCLGNVDLGQEYPTTGSERSYQSVRVVRLTSCSSVSKEDILIGNGLSGNPCEAFGTY